jgi:hypothetical protein
MPWTPCPALPRPYPALAPALPCFEFSFCCQGQEEEVTQGTGSVFFSFCCQGQEEEVTQGTGSVFFPFAARDRRRKLHPALQDRQTDIVTLIY